MGSAGGDARERRVRVGNLSQVSDKGWIHFSPPSPSEKVEEKLRGGASNLPGWKRAAQTLLFLAFICLPSAWMRFSVFSRSSCFSKSIGRSALTAQ